MKKITKYINEQIEILKPNILYYILVYLISYIYLLYTNEPIESTSFPYYSLFTPLTVLAAPFLISIAIFFFLFLNIKRFENQKFGIVFLIITLLFYIFIKPSSLL
jgi:hypothetical protein